MDSGRPLEAVPAEGLGGGGGGGGRQEPELKRLQGLWRWSGRRGPPQARPLWHKPILRTPSSWRSSRLPSLPGFWPHAPFQIRAVQETLNRGRGDSCQLLVFVWLGKPPPFGTSSIVLDFDQDPDQICPLPFLTEPSQAPVPRSELPKTTPLCSAVRLLIPGSLTTICRGQAQKYQVGDRRFLFQMSLSLSFSGCTRVLGTP